MTRLSAISIAIFIHTKSLSGIVRSVQHKADSKTTTGSKGSLSARQSTSDKGARSGKMVNAMRATIIKVGT